MSNYNNVNRVLIGDGANVGAITSIAGIQKGDLFLLSESGTVIATNAAAAALPKHEKVTIACGISSGVAILSSPIQGNTVSKYEGQSYVAPSELVVALGWDGTTSGSGISITAGTEYRLRVLIKDAHRFNGQRSSLGDVNYVAPTGGTVSEALAKIAELYDQTDYSENYLKDKVKLERISNGTFQAADNDVTVVKGSKVITFATAAEYNTGTAFAVGDVIRLGGTGATVPVYVIEEVDGLNITLDVTYKGDSATIAAANAGNIDTPTEWGFKLSGIAQEALLDGYDEYEWVNFDAVFSEAEDRAVESASAFKVLTAINPGQGYWKQVRDREEAAKGYFGDTSKRRFHDKRIVSLVSEGQAYDSVVITHADVHSGDFQDTYRAPLKTEIYIPDGADQGLNSGNNFLHILNGFFGTSVGFTALSF